MRKIWESFKIACSMYSRIPMPKSDWSEENMSYVMCFFPVIGALIGALLKGAFEIKMRFGAIFPELFWTCLFVILPVIVTGGIHLDGFIDTADARSSWREREKKLEILKDPHVGAFALISLAVYFLADLGIYASLTEKSVNLFVVSFVISRIFSALAVLYFPQARKNGSVQQFSKHAKKGLVTGVLLAELIAVILFLPALGGWRGLLVLVAEVLFFGYYYRMSLKSFGGVTGDLAGWFLQMSELLMAFVAVAVAALPI